MRIIFVGVHNKPGKTPLDSSTKTGSLIDRVIAKLPDGVVSLKSNLYNMDRMPESWEMDHHRDVSGWIDRVKYNPKTDFVVLLGIYVGEAFMNSVVPGHRMPHPSSFKMRSKMMRENFIKEIIGIVSHPVMLRNYEAGNNTH